MFKSSSQLLSVVLGLGLIGSNMFSLFILARKDNGGIPTDLASLPNTPYSSVQIRSEKDGDKHNWSFATKQHDPKTMLAYETSEQPTFSGKIKTKHIHKESLAQAVFYPRGEGGKLTQSQIECIEKRAQGANNGQLIADSASVQITPAITGIPIVGPVLAGIFFGQARKQAAQIAGDIALDFNDC